MKMHEERFRKGLKVVPDNVLRVMGRQYSGLQREAESKRDRLQESAGGLENLQGTPEEDTWRELTADAWEYMRLANLVSKVLNQRVH